MTSIGAAARLDAARDALTGLSGALVIAPTRGAADDLVRRCARQAGGLAGVERMTVTQVAAELARVDFAGRNLAPVGGLALEALAARSIFLCRQERRLDYFEPVADTPGFRKALASTLRELRMARLEPGELSAAGAPGSDLARLLGTYAQELQARSLADVAAIYRLAAGVAFPPRPLLLLDLQVESPAERELLSALVRNAPFVFATAPADDRDGVLRLEQLLGAQSEILHAAEDNSLSRLRRHLFSLERPAYAALDSSVEFFSAGGEALECVEIARRIRRFAAERGLAFDRMAVLLRDPERYLGLVEDALRRAGIPAYFTRGVLRPDPAGRAFLALLECASERLSAARFAEYLSLGQAPAEAAEETWVASEDEVHAGYREETEPARDASDARMETEDQPVVAGSLRAPAAWEKLLVEAAVIGGRERWARRLRGLEAEYELQLTEVESEPERARVNRQLRRLRTLSAFALPLIDLLDALPKAAQWGDWLKALAGLARAALRVPEPVLSVLGELEAMAEVGPVGLDEVRSVLAERLRFLRREPDGRRYGKVFVAGIGEAAAMSFDIVFLPGLAEGIFPRKTSEDPLLLDEHRARWAPNLARQDERAARERLLLRTAAGAAVSVFVASYSRLDLAQGRARVPSFYALEVLRAAEGRLPDLREIENRAAQGSTTRLGWPAPQEAAQAIDDAEYDLSVLEPLQFKPPAEVKGYGCYLLAASPTLARSLRTRGRRWRAGWFPADGIVDPQPAARRALGTQSLAARSYSPTALQHFAACPYRFLLYAIHQLRPREEARPLEQLDPLTRGALFHEAQREIFREPGATTEVAGRVLARVAAAYEEKLAPAIPQVWQSEIEAIGIDLRAWVMQLPAIHETWQPLHSEFAFEAVVDGFRLRGAIDLVERNRENGRLRVTDHKTGKVPPLVPVATGGGRILQPVLYGLAAEQIFQTPVEDGLLFYCTQRGNFTRVEIRLDERARAAARQVLEAIEAALQGGFLPAAPAAGDCQWCDYTGVCGPYEEVRVRGKRPERLEALEALRMLP